MDILKKVNSILHSVELKSALIYIIASLFSKGLAIITMPIFTRLMPTDQIGIVNIYTANIALISGISTLSLTSGGFSLAMKEFENDRDRYLSSILSLTSIIALVMGIIFLIHPTFWMNILGMSSNTTILMLLGLLVSPALDFWLARQRYEYKYKKVALLTIGSSVLSSTVSVLCVYFTLKDHPNEIGDIRLLSNYGVIYLIDAIVFVFIMLRGKQFINIKYWKYSLQLSLPLVGYSIASQILNVSDRMMIDKMVGKSEVGIYSTLYSVGSLSIMFWTALNSSFIPYMFRNMENPKSKIKSVSLYLIVIYAGIAIILTYLAPEVIMILATDEYLSAKYIMPPIAAGVFFIAIANIYSNILVYYKKTNYIMYASVIAAVMNIVLNYYGISEFGYMAASYTTLISYAVLALFEYLWSRKVEKENLGEESKLYENNKMIGLSLITMILCLLGLVLYRYTIVRYIFVAVIFLGVMLLWYIYKTKVAVSKAE